MDPLQEQEENVGVSEEVMNIEGSVCIREEDGEGNLITWCSGDAFSWVDGPS